MFTSYNDAIFSSLLLGAGRSFTVGFGSFFDGNYPLFETRLREKKNESSESEAKTMI